MNPNDPQSQEQIEAENEHFYLSESLISWMERLKCQDDDHAQQSLANILPLPPPKQSAAPTSSVNEPSRKPSARRLARSSATGMAWSLAKIFADRQASDSVKLDIYQQLEGHNFDLSTDSDELNHMNGLKIVDGPLDNQQHAGGGGHLEDRERIFQELADEFFVDDIPRLANLVLARTEFSNPENSHSNKSLIKLLRYIDRTPTNTSPAAASESDGSQQQQQQQQQQQEASCELGVKPAPVISATEKYERAVIYARFVSKYLVDLIRRHQSVANYNKKYINSVINNSLIDLEPTLSSEELDMGQKTIVYASLLKCCSSDALDGDSRLLLAKSVVESHALRNKPKLVAELVLAISQFLRDSRILVPMVETLVNLHRAISGESEQRAWASFNLRSIPDELYLSTCVEERAPLALMVYFESLFCLNQPPAPSDAAESAAHLTSSYQVQHQKPLTRNQIWAKFFLWLARLTQALCNLKTSDQLDGPKLTATWLRILALFEPDLAPYLTGDAAAAGDLSPRRPASACSNGAAAVDNEDSQEESMSMSSESELAKSAELRSLVERSPGKPAELVRLARSGSAHKQPQQTSRAASMLTPGHKCLLSFIKQLISFYDSINTSGLWAYLKASAKSEGACRVSVTALAIACFLADRALIQLNRQQQQQQQQLAAPQLGESGDQPAQAAPHLVLLRDELAKLSRVCMGKLEAGRKSKSLLESAQFIETLMESVQQHERVQYGEGVQLIKTYAQAPPAAR